MTSSVAFKQLISFSVARKAGGTETKTAKNSNYNYKKVTATAKAEARNIITIHCVINGITSTDCKECHCVDKVVAQVDSLALDAHLNFGVSRPFTAQCGNIYGIPDPVNVHM